jgi:hypothetical protein
MCRSRCLCHSAVMGQQSAEPSQRRGQPSAQATRGSAVQDDLSQRLADLARDMQR